MLTQTFRGIALFYLLCFLLPVADAAVTLGPYLQNGTKTSMTIHWRSSASGTGRVTYGTDKNNLNSSADESASGTTHVVKISGLQAGTKYFYRVGNGSAQEAPANANEQYFETSPGGAKATRIWVLGDSGTGTAAQNSVRDAYYSYAGTGRTHVVLALGDNAYEDGSDAEYSNNFFSVYRDMFVNTPVWSTQGNHERNQGVYEAIFSLPKNGEGGGVASGTERYYSFNYGDIHFVCMNSYSSAINIDPGAAQYQWLEQDLQANTKPWVIAFWHHPPYSKTNVHNSDTERGMKELRENANTLLEQYGVDLVLGGHNHSYSRTYFINGHYGVEATFDAVTHKVQNGNGSSTPYNKAGNRGAVYVVSGSAGKVTNTLDAHDANVSRYLNLGSFVIDVNGDTLTGKFLRENGSVNDSFSIKKGSANTAPVANAGSDGSVQLGNALALNGSVTDDGFPGNAVTVSWTKVSGPGAVTFSNSGSATASATFDQAGSYVLRLTADDGEFSDSDEVAITVTESPASPVNAAPVAIAGNDGVVQLGNSMALNGSVTDDGFPGNAVTVSWSKVSGPGAVTFFDSGSATTNATFDQAGDYVLRLTADDGELSSNDDINITVSEDPSGGQPDDGGSSGGALSWLLLLFVLARRNKLLCRY